MASYKFALGKSLLELSAKGKEIITLDDLADPYSMHICDHLKLGDKQGTSTSSRFLDACRKFNQGESKKEELLDATAKLGFVNVIDAFHVVHDGDIPAIRFLERLHKQNNFFIDSNHPLRETLIQQTQGTEPERRALAYKRSKELLGKNWEPEFEHEPAF